MVGLGNNACGYPLVDFNEGIEKLVFLKMSRENLTVLTATRLNYCFEIIRAVFLIWN